LLLTTVLLFSGCVQTELNIEVNPDKSGVIETTMKLDKEAFLMLASIDGDDIEGELDEELSKLESNGYTVKRSDTDDSYVFSYGKSIEDIGSLDEMGLLDEDDVVTAEFIESNKKTTELYISLGNVINQSLDGAAEFGMEGAFDMFT